MPDHRPGTNFSTSWPINSSPLVNAQTERLFGSPKSKWQSILNAVGPKRSQQLEQSTSGRAGGFRGHEMGSESNVSVRRARNAGNIKTGGVGRWRPFSVAVWVSYENLSSSGRHTSSQSVQSRRFRLASASGLERHFMTRRKHRCGWSWLFRYPH